MYDTDISIIRWIAQTVLYLTNEEAQVVYYTVIKHGRHLKTPGECRKHEAQVSVFYISQVFSHAQSVLSQYTYTA